MLNRINESFEYNKICNQNKYNILLYLLGCTSIFLVCQILKTSSLIKKDNFHYNQCLSVLKPYLTKDSLTNVCQTLNHHEDFQIFVYNIFYTWLFIYALIREIIKDTFLPFTYWIVGNISAITFSLIGELDIFKFSIDSDTNYTEGHIIIVSLVCGFLGITIIRQIYYNKVKYDILFTFISMYLFAYLLFISISEKVIFHLHHALVSGLLSLFFIDFQSNFEKYMHAILIGIVIQGFNFFSSQEIFMFYIPNTRPPTIIYLIILYSIFFISWISILIFRNKCCYRNNAVEQHFEMYERML